MAGVRNLMRQRAHFFEQLWATKKIKACKIQNVDN